MDISDKNAAESDPNTAAALIARGRASRKQGDHSQALQHFLAAAAAAPGDPAAELEIGYSLCALHRAAEAEPHLRAVLMRDPQSVPALSELGRIVIQRGDHSAALEFLTRASTLHPRSIPLQVEIGRALQLLGRHDEAEIRYQKVLGESPGNIACLERLGDISHGKNDADAALAWFEQALGSDPRSPSIQFKVARSLHALSRFDEAEQRYLALLDQVPDYYSALKGLAALARLRGKHQIALDRLQTAAAMGPFKLQLQHRIGELLREMSRFDEAERLYRAILEVVPGDLNALVGMGTIERKRENYEASLTYFQGAASKVPDNPKLGIHVVNALRSVGRIEEADAALTKLECSPNVDDAEKLLWRFEHLCLTLQLSEAEKYVHAWNDHRKVPRAAVHRTAQLYAALGRWPEILDFMRERVITDVWIDSCDDLMEPLARCARGTGRYAEACDILDRLLARTDSEAIRETRDQLVEEMRLISLLDADFGGSHGHSDTAIQSSLRTNRAELFARVLGKPAAPPKPVHIYLCTDAAYLLGASVCLFSLLKYNRANLKNCQLLVFCDQDVIELATAVFGQMVSAFGIAIDVRASSTLLSMDLEFRTGWGVFTAGRGLSRAAYYRIYAARQLLDQGAKGRALYIDSDTCVFAGIDQFFEFDLAERPLGACLDDNRKPGIRRAAKLLGVDPDRYFNSGILLFDLEHLELRAALDDSIRIALTEPERLSFVDQCALNLAFQGKFTILPERFNMFVAPNMAEQCLPVDPLVEHFISQPKPWDPMYPTTNGEPWLREFAGFGRVIDSDLIRRALALQYRGSSASTRTFPLKSD